MNPLHHFLIASVLLGAIATATAKEKTIALRDVPAPVKNAIEAFIKNRAKGATIEEIEVEKEQGRKVYEFELKTADGAELEVEIDARGEILEVERDDDDHEHDDHDGEDDD